MIEHITRIQFHRDRATIYSDLGVFAIWRGKKARILSDLCLESIRQIIERESQDEETDQIGPI